MNTACLIRPSLPPATKTIYNINNSRGVKGDEHSMLGKAFTATCHKNNINIYITQTDSGEDEHIRLGKAFTADHNENKSTET